MFFDCTFFYPNRIWKAPCWQSALEIGWSSLDLNLKTGWLANEGKDETITVLWLQWEECQQMSRHLCRLSWIIQRSVSHACQKPLQQGLWLFPQRCPRCTAGQEGLFSRLGSDCSAKHGFILSCSTTVYFLIHPHILSTLSHLFLWVDI